MPPLPAASKCLRVALSGTDLGAETWLTRFYLQYSGVAPVVTDLITFNGAIASAYTAHLQGLVHPDYELTQIETIDLTSSSGAVAASPQTIVGTLSGARLPASACTVVSYSIARRYRGGHPRGYWPFGTDAQILDQGHWTTAFIGTVDTDIGAFFTAVLAAVWSGGGTLSHVNLSYFSGFTVVVSPTTGRARNVPTLRTTPTVDVVTALKAQQSIGTQRRRIGFVD